MSVIKISVIIPTFDVKDYLGPCLESVLNQDFNLPYEIILSDFGSRDGTTELCTSFEMKYPERIYVIHSNKNYGVSASRNAGLLAARGEFVTFIDSDDIIKPNYLSTLYNLAKKTDSDITTCGYYIYKKNPHIGWSRSSFKGTGRECLKKLYQSPHLRFRTFCWGRLYRTQLLRDNNIIFDSDLDRFEDWVFIFKAMFVAKKVVFTPKPLYFYRQRKGSVMESALEIITPHMKALAKTKDFANENDPDYKKVLFDKPRFAIKAQVFYDCMYSHKGLKTSTHKLYKIYSESLKQLFDENKMKKMKKTKDSNEN